MIGDALLKNKYMKLRKFAATRSRLEEDGMASLSKVFFAQQSIQIIELSQNGSKRALAPLLKAMVMCKDSL